MRRTHHCNELRPAHIGQTVTLDGWVHSRRDLGGLIFIDVRDREGRTQSVFDPSDLPKELFEQAAGLRSECVVSVTGKVRPRPAGTNNPKIPTGEIEIAAARDDGTAPFAPKLAGGTAAGLYSVANAGELLLLTCRLLTLLDSG